MKQTFRQYGAVVAMLATVLALSVLVTALAGNLSFGADKTKGKTVLATTYPIYVAALNILGDDPDVTLTRLDGAAAGCLHDYQMSPSDRRAVQAADLILLNGAGAETFLHGIVEESKCVDTSAGLDLLLSEGEHHHDHAEGEHPHEEMNEHLWLSPTLYAKQVEAVLNALITLDPNNEETYRRNATEYLTHIYGIQVELAVLKTELEGAPCVLFHDSMAYLAADLGLDVKLTLSVEGESGLSAHHLGEVERLAAEHPDLLLLYDTQYALRYEGVAGNPVTIDTAVRGQNRADDWLTAMRHNVDMLKQITQGGGAG